jgi:hypothetical protein
VAVLKKGNLMAHARASGKRVMLTPKKKTVAKRAPAKRAAVTGALKPQYKYCLQVRRTAAGLWSKVAGMDSKASIVQLARSYAARYPTFSFRVV